MSEEAPSEDEPLDGLAETFEIISHAVMAFLGLIFLILAVTVIKSHRAKLKSAVNSVITLYTFLLGLVIISIIAENQAIIGYLIIPNLLMQSIFYLMVVHTKVIQITIEQNIYKQLFHMTDEQYKTILTQKVRTTRIILFAQLFVILACTVSSEVVLKVLQNTTAAYEGAEHFPTWQEDNTHGRLLRVLSLSFPTISILLECKFIFLFFKTNTDFA